MPTPTALPVSAAEIDAYLAAHASELRGPPERDRAAVRFFLERERRYERERALVAAERTRTPPELPGSPTARSTASDDPSKEPLARVGGRTIRRADVEERARLGLYRLRGELARERLRRLDELIAEHLWAAAARARGVPVEVLRDEVQRGVPPVTDADIHRYFVDEVQPRDPGATESAERIRPYLEFRARHAAEQALLAAARERTPVTILLREPEPPRLALDAGPGGWRGPPKPRSHALLLTSYRGTASRRAWTELRDLAAAEGIALGVRPLLPQWDPEATAVAAAARCAAEQGRFWELHDALASADPLPDPPTITRLATSLGLDEPALAACAASAATFDAIAADSAAAEGLGLDRPPVVLLDGLVLGAPSSDRLRAALRAGEGAARPTAAGTPAWVSVPSSSASASP